MHTESCTGEVTRQIRYSSLNMNRIKQLRQQDISDARTRWWRDGLTCAAIGAFVGMIFAWVYSPEPAWTIAGFGLGAGIAGAIFGDRVLRWLQ